MAVQAWAAPVLTFNTGVDGAGVVLANGVADTHYTLTASTFGLPGQLPIGSPLIAHNASAGFPIPPWTSDAFANLAASRWVTPQNGAVDGFSGVGVPATVQTFTYSTTFDLTGFVPGTAVLTGFFAADNSAVAFLNTTNNIGTATSFNNAFAFGTANPTHFFAGVNTLTFVVTNAAGTTPNPTGLRVQYGVTANLVPEINPGSASLPLAVIAMVVLVLADRRRLRIQA